MNKFFKSIYLWIDSSALKNTEEGNKIDILRVLPFIFIHVACIGVFFIEFTWQSLAIMLFTYSLRVFALTGFYHRYFSHRAFKTSRLVQFIFAFIGTSATQRGPLWWSAHHRFHHKHSDEPLDKHSPHVRGFFWSHCGWFLQNENFATNEENIKDLVKFPELKWLNRFDVIPPVVLAVALYLCGGLNFLFWGYFVSTVLIYHVTFSINSLAHLLGTRDFETKDQSRNNWLLALLSFGEGWHNNHHYYPSSARQGFKPWQIDISFYIIKLMEKLGLVWDIRELKMDSQQRPILNGNLI